MIRRNILEVGVAGFLFVFINILAAQTSSNIPSSTSSISVPTISSIPSTTTEGKTAAGASFSDASSSPDARALLAMTNTDYPVTPGDIYSLNFTTAAGVTFSSIVVDSDCNVNLSNMGVISGKGLSFQQLKRLVEKRVNDSFSYSAPQLFIKTPGTFSVNIKGEVVVSGYHYAWGLTRLSELNSNMTSLASMRDIEILSKDGADRHYDLFIATRSGDLSQDPFLRAGDTIIYKRYTRCIILSGEINRPGNYQLLDTDTIADLVDRYGDGATKLADLSFIKLNRYITGSAEVGETIFLDYTNLNDRAYVLKDLDVVSVPSRTDNLPVIFLEGAVSPQQINTNNADLSRSASPDVSSKISCRFNVGDTLHGLLMSRFNIGDAMHDTPPVKSPDAIHGINIGRIGKILPDADLEKAFIQRGDKVISVDLQKLLYQYSENDDVVLAVNDRVIIPFKQYFVTVGGAVYRPGSFPYVPGRSWKYYVNLAGGINEELNSWNVVYVSDMNDVKKPLSAIIEPEDKILVPSNSILHLFNQISGITSVLVSALTAFIYLRSLNIL